MFVEQVVPSASPAEPGGPDDARASRRQYTLKGVEQEAIDLMRMAAEAQGMKIGHWVSDRLKEAARKALVDANRHRDILQRIADDSDEVCYDTLLFGKVENTADKAALMERVQRLELEVQNLTRKQMDLLSLVLTKMTSA